MTLIHSASSRSARLLGGLAFGLGLTLLSAATGCSSDDTSNDMTPATGTDGGAGSSGSAGAGGTKGETGGGAVTEAGTSGAGGSAGTSSTSDAGLCAHAQMASDIGDHCNADAGLIKQAATTCPAASDAAAQAAGDAAVPFSHSGTFTDDDDCKYDVAYGIACAGATTTFNITLTSRSMAAADGGVLGVTGANPQVEAMFNDDPTHLLPSTPKPVTTEIGNGDYQITNVPLDKDGFWTVRFNFFNECADTETTSKHGGVSFTVIMR